MRSAYDDQDKVAVLSVGRNLTLVNLNNMASRNTFTYWVGYVKSILHFFMYYLYLISLLYLLFSNKLYRSRIFGKNVVYNHENKRVVIFQTRVPIRGNYGLSVDEYSVESGSFVEVATTYNCLCGEDFNLTASPFYKVLLTDCEMDYSTTPARIWCAVPEQQKFIAFNANNLTDITIIYPG